MAIIGIKKFLHPQKFSNVINNQNCIFHNNALARVFSMILELMKQIFAPLLNRLIGRNKDAPLTVLLQFTTSAQNRLSHTVLSLTKTGRVLLGI
jgi:hypothetical protein